MIADLPSARPIVGTIIVPAAGLRIASSDDFAVVTMAAELFTALGVEKLRGSGPRTLAADMQAPQ